jgi:hypothetical protein
LRDFALFAASLEALQAVTAGAVPASCTYAQIYPHKRYGVGGMLEKEPLGTQC